MKEASSKKKVLKEKKRDLQRGGGRERKELTETEDTRERGKGLSSAGKKRTIQKRR